MTMSWPGGWSGPWLGDWQGDSEPGGFANASVHIQGAGAAWLAAEATGGSSYADCAMHASGSGHTHLAAQGGAVETPSSGGGLGGYAPAPRQPRYVAAAMQARGHGRTGATAATTERQPGAFADCRATVGAGGTLSAQPSASAPIGVMAAGPAHVVAPAVALASASMLAQGAGATHLAATITRRDNVVPIRPVIDLAEDEIAALYLLLAA